MSARLKADAALCWARTTLMRVPYFQGENLEDNFLASTALCLQTRVFCRSEYLQVDDLQIVERGICAKQGRIFAKGSCLGEDMVLADAIFRDLTPAVALTFVAQVAAMEKKHLEQLLNEYPIARRKIRAATYRLALCRAMVALARIFSREEETNGQQVTMTQALSIIRAEKMRSTTRLVEPTKRVIINTLGSLQDSVEEISRSQASTLDILSSSLAAGKLGKSNTAEVHKPPAASAVVTEQGHGAQTIGSGGDGTAIDKRESAQIASLREEVRSIASKLDTLLSLHTTTSGSAGGGAAGGLGATLAAPPPQRMRTGGRSGVGGERPPGRKKQRASGLGSSGHAASTSGCVNGHSRADSTPIGEGAKVLQQPTTATSSALTLASQLEA
jgi:hypothetical protein